MEKRAVLGRVPLLGDGSGGGGWGQTAGTNDEGHQEVRIPTKHEE